MLEGSLSEWKYFHVQINCWKNSKIICKASYVLSSWAYFGADSIPRRIQFYNTHWWKTQLEYIIIMFLFKYLCSHNTTWKVFVLFRVRNEFVLIIQNVSTPYFNICNAFMMFDLQHVLLKGKMFQFQMKMIWFSEKERIKVKVSESTRSKVKRLISDF